jgi:predicted Fe-Mo cluster-binding NifX family protein
MLWSMGKQSGLKEAIIWLKKALVYSNAMNARMNGRNPMEPEDQPDARNATVRTSTELQMTEDTREEAEEREAEDMGRTRLAIPCTGEADLQAQVSAHFGHCDSYAIVTLQEGRIEAVESMSNQNHIDCGASVRRLVENGVGLMLVQSMGMQPYLAFKELGIEVRCGITGTIAGAVECYLKGETSPMGQDSLCEHHVNTNELRKS